jgi:hypothetical protein
MRPHQDAGIPQARVAALADRLDPPQDETGFVRVRRHDGADVQQDRMLRRQPDGPAERIPVARRGAIEPLVVALGAGHRNAIVRHPVPRHRLTLLRLVPQQDAIRHASKQRLAGQMVPTEYAHAGSNPEVPRGA